MDIRVAAIREDTMVGRGSCTLTDETFSDEELTYWLDEDEVYTTKGAVEWARDYEHLKIEMAVEYESPTAMDRLQEWKNNLDKNPVRC